MVPVPFQMVPVPLLKTFRSARVRLGATRCQVFQQPANFVCLNPALEQSVSKSANETSRLAHFSLPSLRDFTDKQ